MAESTGIYSSIKITCEVGWWGKGSGGLLINPTCEGCYIEDAGAIPAFSRSYHKYSGFSDIYYISSVDVQSISSSSQQEPRLEPCPILEKSPFSTIERRGWTAASKSKYYLKLELPWLSLLTSRTRVRVLSDPPIFSTSCSTTVVTWIAPSSTPDGEPTQLNSMSSSLLPSTLLL